jgi:hypothetical protein
LSLSVQCRSPAHMVGLLAERVRSSDFGEALTRKERKAQPPLETSTSPHTALFLLTLHLNSPFIMATQTTSSAPTEKIGWTPPANITPVSVLTDRMSPPTERY